MCIRDRNIIAGPIQPFANGVTEIVVIIGAPVLLIAVNEGRFPVPPTPRPINELLFVQENVVPLTKLEKGVSTVFNPLHTA